MPLRGAELSHASMARRHSQLHSGNTAVSYLQAKRRYYRFGVSEAVARA